MASSECVNPRYRSQLMPHADWKIIPSCNNKQTIASMPPLCKTWVIPKRCHFVKSFWIHSSSASSHRAKQVLKLYYARLLKNVWYSWRTWSSSTMWTNSANFRALLIIIFEIFKLLTLLWYGKRNLFIYLKYKNYACLMNLYSKFQSSTYSNLRDS